MAQSHRKSLFRCRSQSRVNPKTNEASHEMTPADVQAFLDGFVPMQLERENIAGAVVLVVKDGKNIFR